MKENGDIETLRSIASLLNKQIDVSTFKDAGVWRFLSPTPKNEEMVCFWGNVGIGDLVMPWPMVVSHGYKKDSHTDPYAFWVLPTALYTLVKIDFHDHMYSFCMLPTNEKDPRLVWFHLKSSLVTKVSIATIFLSA